MSKQLDDRTVDIQPTLAQLLERSAQTLDEILQDDSVAATDRAEIALRIVALAGGLNVPTLPTPTVRATTGQLGSVTPQPDPVPMPQPAPVSATPSIQQATPGDNPDPYAIAPDLLPGNYLLLDDFLSVEDNEQLLQLAIDKQPDYVASSTSTNAEKYRSSWVLYPTFFTDFYYFFSERLRGIFSEVLTSLQLPEFAIDELEMQLTAHGDGNFYKTHNDSDGEVVKRTLTYVYYFNREPKPYRGGNLRMYETAYRNGWIAQSNFQDIEPKNNRLVLFDSRCMHEVRPIESDSTDFADCRFTLNGWLRRP